MADFEHLFIHPLLGAGDVWSGFLIETAPGTNTTEETLGYLGQHSEFQSFDKRSPWFFPPPLETGNPEIFRNPLVAAFSAQAKPTTDGDTVAALETNLRQHRKKIALIAAHSQKLPGTGAWDFLLITASHARSLPPYSLSGLATRSTIVATEVHSHTDHEWAKTNGCTLCTTEFLLSRHLAGKKADLTRIKLLELLSLIVADADTAEIEGIFRQEPKLAYSLLRLVNSAANAPRSVITSFSQAINLLGRRQLQRWLQLLVFADQNSGQHANPLLQKAATRGRMMELLADGFRPADSHGDYFQDAAFMVGTFSLLDVLLNMPFKEILQHLPLPEIVRNALSEHAGPLGHLLKTINAMESRDLSAAKQQLQALSVSATKQLDAQLAALSWAAKIHPVT